MHAAQRRRSLRVLVSALGALLGGCADERTPPAPAVTDPSLSPAQTEQGTGFLLDSEPLGAALFVDGTAIATTPAYLYGLSPGTHAIRLEFDGYRPWQISLHLKPGTSVVLPTARLIAVARQPSIRLAAHDAAPTALPNWPRDRFPEDLEVVVEASYGPLITLRARGESSIAEAISDIGPQHHRTCRLTLDRRALERFGWPAFVDAIATGRQHRCRHASCSEPRASIRAFGRTLSPEDVSHYDLALEIGDRLAAVLQGLERWPGPDFPHALRRLDGAIWSCAEERQVPQIAFAIAPRSERARLLSFGARRATPAELACMREAVAAAAFPASPCDARVVLYPNGMQRILPNPYR